MVWQQQVRDRKNRCHNNLVRDPSLAYLVGLVQNQMFNQGLDQCLEDQDKARRRQALGVSLDLEVWAQAWDLKAWDPEAWVQDKWDPEAWDLKAWDPEAWVQDKWDPEVWDQEA